MFSTYTRDALAVLLGCTTTHTIEDYVLAPDGLWLRVDWQAWQSLTDQERSAAAGNDWPMCQKDMQDMPAVANDGTILIGRFGREPLLPFPFTALLLWEYDRDTGGAFSEHLPLDAEDWIAERLAEGGPGNEAVVRLARVLLADKPPQDEAQAQDTEKEADFMDETLGAAMFFALPHVTPVQAAMLLCRFNPDNEAEKDAENCTTDCTKPEDFKRLRTLFNSVDQATPANRSLLDWMEIADEIKCKFHPWAWRYVKQRELYGPSEPAIAPPTSTTSAPVENSVHGDDAWKERAREKASEIIKRQKAIDVYPSQGAIADEIAREFRKSGIVGAGGKPLAGSYIKRHALKGISSEQGRYLSTSIRQGK